MVRTLPSAVRISASRSLAAQISRRCSLRARCSLPRPLQSGSPRAAHRSAAIAGPSASASWSICAFRAALGDRDQEAVGVLGVVAAERVAGGDSALGAALEDGVDRGVEADRELARDRRLVQELDPVDRGEPLARVGGAPDQQLAELAVPSRPSQARWTIAASAFSACAVQMLWVAFSRRMCCSRVCSARTKPRRPSTSSVSPAIRPGIRRIRLLGRRRRSRTRGRRSRAGCRAAGPRRGRCRRRTRRAGAGRRA